MPYNLTLYTVILWVYSIWILIKQIRNKSIKTAKTLKAVKNKKRWNCVRRSVKDETVLDRRAVKQVEKINNSRELQNFSFSVNGC